MKVIILIIAICTCSFGFSQNWRSFTIQDFGEPLGSWWGYGDGAEKSFIINPQDNSFWMLKLDRLTTIDANGNHTRIDLSTHSELPDGNYVEIALDNQNYYLIDEYSGLYRYNGTTWGLQQSFMWGYDISWDNDTMLIGITSQNPSATMSPVGVFQYEQFDAWRVRRKNGVVWYTNGSGIPWRYYSGTYGVPVLADTSVLLDEVINDFKFSPFSDSLFVAGELGISIADSYKFVDTVTQHNTINMPTGSVDQFEFDQNGNIWALFGEGFDQTDLAYLDRSTMTWTQVYDETNSPINFPTKAAIELDSFGNVWIVENNKLHSLTIASDSVSWLGVKEDLIGKIQMFPNPSNGTINFEIDPTLNVETIQILDFSGRLVESIPFEKSISLDLERGTYLIQLKLGKSIIATEKHIVR